MSVTDPTPFSGSAGTADDKLVAEIETLAERLRLVRDRVGRVIFGQEHVVDQAVITLLGGGHCLLIGVPGLAKTKLVETLGVVLGLEGRRIQFTPDLMPSDILGSEVMEQGETGRRSFRFIKGPIFAQLLMADEINRASPRTQSALLQAMQEREVTIAGQHRPLGAPFHVLATQNPIEQEGTYPLPEAQLDRFLVQIDVDYPDRETERAILLATTGSEDVGVSAIFAADELIAAQALIRRMPVGESVVGAILDLVRACRPGGADADASLGDSLSWGPGPRAAQALMLAVRSRALIAGRLAPSAEDVAALARPVLTHRMALSFAARARGEDLGAIIDRVAGRVTGSTEAAA